MHFNACKKRLLKATFSSEEGYIGEDCARARARSAIRVCVQKCAGQREGGGGVFCLPTLSRRGVKNLLIYGASRCISIRVIRR